MKRPTPVTRHAAEFVAFLLPGGFRNRREIEEYTGWHFVGLNRFVDEMLASGALCRRPARKRESGSGAQPVWDYALCQKPWVPVEGGECVEPGKGNE